MMQQMIYQSTIKIQFSSIHLGRLIDNSTLFGQGNNLPRLAVNMPHAVLSFVVRLPTVFKLTLIFRNIDEFYSYIFESINLT